MQMNWRYAGLSLLAGGLLMSTGCGTLIKQGYYTATGAQGSFYELKVVDPLVLQQYEAVRLQPFANQLGPVVPREVISYVNNLAPEALAEERLFYPTGKRLRIEGEIIHYTGKSGIEGAASAIISGGQVCVTRVRLFDDETDALVGEGVCWGAVKSALRRGADEYGEGVGKGIAKWIAERLPRDELERRREELKED